MLESASEGYNTELHNCQNTENSFLYSTYTATQIFDMEPVTPRTSLCQSCGDGEKARTKSHMLSNVYTSPIER